MNILIISGSQRNNSKSYDIATYIQANILNKIENITSKVLDLSVYPYLLEYYGRRQDQDSKLADEKAEVLTMLYECDAVIIISPEWGGMIPPALVNLFLLTANGSANGLPLGHKPAFAIGLSASGGGSNPISILKGYAAKNSYLTWLPLHAIIQNAENFLRVEWSPNLDNRYSNVQSRLLVGLNSLIIYARQLSSVREELVLLSKVHPFGQ